MFKGKVPQIRKVRVVEEEDGTLTRVIETKVTLATISRLDHSEAKSKINGHWLFEDVLAMNKEMGFIYLIHDLEADKMYIGQKLFVGTGKLNRHKESDWKYYISSSEELSTLIRVNGRERFKFYVLEEYRYKSSLTFAETWSLMRVEAPANHKKWYNARVERLTHPVRECITERHKRRLDMITSGRGAELESF